VGEGRYEQRRYWRSSHAAAARSTQGESPLGLRLLGETGESRIEIKNGTKKEIAEAKRLFPEATVVAAGEAPEATQAAPAAVPAESLPAAKD